MWVFASSHAQAGGRGHAAHEHGVAEVNIVAEGKTVTVQLEAPSESIYGFEYEAKSAADIKKRDNAVERLRNNAETLFVFDTSLGCKISGTEVKPFVSDSLETKGSKKGSQKTASGTHGEVQATFTFQCAKAVAGSTLRFALRSQFASLRTLKVQVLSGENQSGVTLKEENGKVQL
jgi:hypothetical protein